VTLPSLGAAQWPAPRNLSGAQTERLSNYINNHYFGEKQGRGENILKKLGADMGKLAKLSGFGEAHGLGRGQMLVISGKERTKNFTLTLTPSHQGKGDFLAGSDT
jgi:hypothetical protein